MKFKNISKPFSPYFAPYLRTDANTNYKAIQALACALASYLSLPLPAMAEAPFDTSLRHIGVTNDRGYRDYLWGNQYSNNLWFGTHVGKDYSEGAPTSISFGRVSKLTSTGSYPDPADVHPCASRDCGLGNSVMVKYLRRDGSYIYSLYGHLDSNDGRLQLNRHVVAGQRIGIMGSTGKGSGGIVHLHFELKCKNDLGTGLTSPLGWGYLPFGATASSTQLDPGNYCYESPNAVLADQTNDVALPFLSQESENPSLSNYAVFGTAEKSITAQLRLRGQFQRAAILVRQSGNRNLAEVADALDEGHKFLGGVHANEWIDGISGVNSYAAGDYLVLAFVQQDSENRFGYPVKFTFLPAGGMIVDNDQANADANTANDPQTGPVYNGSKVTAALGSKVPGYYLSADLFPGHSNTFAQWKPRVAGSFRIMVHVPSYGATATNVRYKIRPEVPTVFRLPTAQFYAAC